MRDFRERKKVNIISIYLLPLVVGVLLLVIAQSKWRPFFW